MLTSLLYTGLGAAILCIVFFDLLITTLTTEGVGPVSNSLSNTIWWLLTKLSASLKHSFLMSLAGPAVLILIILSWVFLTWMGWTLIFSAGFVTIEESHSATEATLAERIYYVGYTITTVGYGDFIAANRVTQILSIFAGIHGLSLFTLGITYSIQVLTAVAEKRRLALLISVTLTTNRHGLSSAHQDSQRLLDKVSALNKEIAGVSQKYLAFPIIHFFHDRSRKDSLPLQIRKLQQYLNKALHFKPLSQDSAIQIKQSQRLIRTLAGNSLRHLYVPGSLLKEASKINNQYLSLDKLLFIYVNSTTNFDTARTS